MKTILVVSAAALMLTGCNTKAPRGGGGNPGGSFTRKKPLNPGKPQTVFLHWTGNKWWVQLNGGPDQEPSTAETSLPYDTGPTMFEVTIHGKPGVKFKPDGLIAWEASKSNPAGSTQILGPIVSADGQKLIFFDLNQGPQLKIYYTLKLDDGTSSGISVDPIVNNGGGGNMAQ